MILHHPAPPPPVLSESHLLDSLSLPPPLLFPGLCRMQTTESQFIIVSGRGWVGSSDERQRQRESFLQLLSAVLIGDALLTRNLD